MAIEQNDKQQKQMSNPAENSDLNLGATQTGGMHNGMASDDSGNEAPNINDRGVGGVGGGGVSNQQVTDRQQETIGTPNRTAEGETSTNESEQQSQSPTGPASDV